MMVIYSSISGFLKNRIENAMEVMNAEEKSKIGSVLIISQKLWIKNSVLVIRKVILSLEKIIKVHY